MDNQWSFDLLLLLLLIASLLLIKKVEPVKITSVEIPRVVRAGTEEPTILDCKYDLESSTTAALVVKWYVDEELLYQWIHNSPPKGSDEFEKFVDATYKASNDPNTMYRAVKLVRPSHELSGKIRCSISTQEDETDASEDMLVYSPETVFRLSDPMINEDSTQLTTRCLAEDLYPLPTIKLFQDNQPIKKQKQYYKNKTDGRYSVEAVATLWMDQIKLPTTFKCELFIKEANYTSIKTYVYNGGSAQSNVSLLLISLIIGFFLVTTTTITTQTTTVAFC
ncbi:uncharacterized protein LOC130663314 isoform X1 [Microplitis mediator]|uniref:uncharacterized protein LOC130663314 isoform X1 n=1 Tax=Microplitis mediator TaxID=375433 RepID=UPI002553C71E|nr:uncharacterized protein LOC130663314 isoform X1 [Microplitis mediator]